VQEFGAQFRRGIGEITFRKPIKKFGASVIVQPVLATRGRLANIEVVVGQPDSSFAQFRQQGPIAIQSYVEAIFKELLGLRRRLTKREDSQGADLRQDTKEEREKYLPSGGFGVVLSPFLFVACARNIVEKFPPGHPRQILTDFVSLQCPGNSRGFRNERTDAVPVGVDYISLIGQDGFEIQSISFQERPLSE